jgi:hypothetical protein
MSKAVKRFKKIARASVFRSKQQQMEATYFRLFDANGNGKQKFVFHGQQAMNSNRQLLFQQLCPSMVLVNCLLNIT